MKNTMSSVLMPFARDIKTRQYVGIDEVPNGIACNCVCISCGMILEARHGEEREHHFKHRSKAETECKISYWVSIRSIAEQILEQSNFIYIPFLSTKFFQTASIQIKNVDRGFSKQHQFTFDLKLNTSIGEIFIYFLTGEGSVEGRNRSYFDLLPEYFSDSLILEIDLKAIKENHSQAKAYLHDLIINRVDNKNIYVSQQSYSNTNQRIIKPVDDKRQRQPRLKLDDYKDFIMYTLGYKNLDMFDSEDLLVCSRMVAFFQDKTNKIDWHNLWKYHVGIGAKLVCVALIRTDYFVYTIDQDNQIKIIEKLGSQFIVHRYLNNYDKQVLIEKKQKTYVADFEKMRRIWNIFQASPHKFIEKYTIVIEAWGIKIVCYKSTYFGIVRDQEEWLIYQYQVSKNKIKIIARIPLGVSVRQFIEDKVDKESDLF
jgi:hypothetical protein